MFAQERFGFFVTVGGQVVEDHSSAGLDLGDQHVADVGDKGGAVHRPFDDPRCDQIGWPEACNQGLGSP